MTVVEKVKNPTWSKLPKDLEALMAEPWRFNLYKAINLLEHHWAVDNELATGLSQRVKVVPNKELSFPATDIKACDLDINGHGKITLETSFLGLYGVDAPMPHYLLEQALEENENAKRVRVFLDIFNHISYCQLYQVWKKSQLNLAGLGAKQYDDILNALLEQDSEERFHNGLASTRQTSAAGLTQLLKQELDIEAISIDDTKATWRAVGKVSTIGHNNTILGDNCLLGDKALVTGELLYIEIGPLEQKDAQPLYPQQYKGKQLVRLLKQQVGHSVEWKIKLLVSMPEVKARQIDGTHRLGIDTCLGNVPQKIQKIELNQHHFN